MKTPLISVVMATFNEPVEYIKASIESVLDQTYKNIELIIVDDSTKLDTKDIIDFYSKDNRVVVLRESKRIGFVKALNKGLITCKGSFIARMDGDDIANKDRLEIQIEYLSKNKDIDILGGAMCIIDGDGTVISERHYPTNKMKLMLWTVLRNPLGHPTVMFRRNIIEENNLYDETFTKAEDLEFWLRLRNKGYNMINVSNVLVNFRVVGDLALKRTGENFEYNYRARLKNFSFRYLFLDLCSLLVIKLYSIAPRSLFSIIYSKENR